MSEDKPEGAFPVALFIDTNILDSLPEDLQSGDLSGLVDTAEKTGARVYIPDVVAREWCKHRFDRFFDGLGEYWKKRDYLKKYFPGIPSVEITKDDFMNNVHRRLIARLRRSGCRILGPAKTTIRELTIRAVWEEPPFRGSNRGFKDELVVLSMLKLVERGWNYRTYVLVTRDADFQVKSLEERFRKRHVTFAKVQSLHEARELLVAKSTQERLAAWEQARAKAEAEIRTFLSDHWNAISQAVTRKFSEEGVSTLIIQGHHEKDVPEHTTIRRIVKISPIDIGTIDLGREDEKTNERPITIGVKTTLTLEVEQNPFLFKALFGTIGPEGRKSPRRPIEAHVKELDVVRELPCYATVRRDNEGSLCRLDLVDMRPDYRALVDGIRPDSTPLQGEAKQ